MVIFIFCIVSIPLKQKNKLEFHKRASENKDFCNVNIPFDDTKIL